MFETYFCWYFNFEIILSWGCDKQSEPILIMCCTSLWLTWNKTKITFQDASDESTTTHDNKK